MQHLPHPTPRTLSRRRFLAAAAGLGAAAFGASCGSDGGSPAPASPPAAATSSARPRQGAVLVGDVLDHALWDDRWPGAFGYVTFRLHQAFVDGEEAFYIRTDASDEEFAKREKLVFAPIMAKGLTRPGAVADLFLFEGSDHPAVLSTAPHRADFTPAFRVNRVTFVQQAQGLRSAEAVLAAAENGQVRVTTTDIVVNFPVVQWPGGSLPVDDERAAYLGKGQLLEPPDTATGRVTFKLHGCFPSSWYIVTDTTSAPMADMMHIAAAPSAAGLTEAGATARILVFGNGIEGSGPMGFQKSVMDSTAGDPSWSPYWDHYTYLWTDGSTPSVLKAPSDIARAVEAGRLREFPGTPDTNGRLFMVNCPVPVLAVVA